MDVTLEQVAAQVSEVAKHVAEVTRQLGETEQRLKTHVDEAQKDLKHQAQVYNDELKQEVKLAAGGYGATLDGIKRELADLNKQIDTRLGDHDLVLGNHNERITTLAKRR